MAVSDNDRPSALFPGVGADWRVAPEGQPLTALRCSCPEPVMGDGTCIWCGRERRSGC
jgi:hypothetical protein